MPANPILLNSDPADPNGRFTLRDLLAAFSLAGMRSAVMGYAVDPDLAAKYAYADADAMLVEREKVTP